MKTNDNQIYYKNQMSYINKSFMGKSQPKRHIKKTEKADDWKNEGRVAAG